MSPSRVDKALLAVAVACAAVGVAAHLTAFSQPDSWFLTGATLGTLAATLAVDRQRFTNLPVAHPAERWLARWLVLAALALAAVGLAAGLADNVNRNLWSVLGVVVAFCSLTVAVDAHRISLARTLLTGHRVRGDLSVVICAGLAAGTGLFGTLSGLAGYRHAEAWLFAGVVLAIVAVALALGEQFGSLHHVRRHARAPFHTARDAPGHAAPAPPPHRLPQHPPASTTGSR